MPSALPMPHTHSVITNLPVYPQALETFLSGLALALA